MTTRADLDDSRLLVGADLRFSIESPDQPAGRNRCDGQVWSNGSDLTVEFDPMPSLGGGSTRPLVRPLAEQLDRHGLTIHIVGPSGPLVRLGAGVRAPWWQWPATHGSRIELVSLRALAGSVRGPKLFQVALPPAWVLPAVTDRQRSQRRRVGTRARQLIRRVTGSRR